MQAAARACQGRDVSLLRTILRPCAARRLQRAQRWPQSCHPVQILTRGAKTKSTKKAAAIPSLAQGALEPLTPVQSEEQDDTIYPSYPPVLQGVRDNMTKFKNCMLLTRVGNFYEMYFKHAEDFGPPMSLKLTYRTSNKHDPVAMAGFPFWQLDRYLKMLVQEHNQHVAISEEIPNGVDSKLKTGGNKFDREVVRIVTPGTLIDEKFMDTAQNNFLLAVDAGDSFSSAGRAAPSDVGLAWIDLSTGDFWTGKTPRALLASSVARIAAREIVLQDNASADIKQEIQALLAHHHDLVTYHTSVTSFGMLADWNHCFESPISTELEQSLSTLEKRAIHHLLVYADQQLQRTQLRLQPPRQRNDAEVLSIDRHSLRGLEILETSRDGFGKGSLLHAVNRTATKSGARLLRQRLVSPSASINEINNRLDLVAFFLDLNELRDDIVQRLRRTYDVQRVVQKFTLNKGDADDMLSLAKDIEETSTVYQMLSSASSAASDDSSGQLASLLQRISLEQPLRLAEHITESIDEEGLMQAHRQEDEEAAEVAASAIDVAQSEGVDTSEYVGKSARVKARVAENRFSDNDMLETWVMKRTANDVIGRLHEELGDIKREIEELQTRLKTELGAKTLTLKWAPGKGYHCHVRGSNGVKADALEQMGVTQSTSTKSTRSFYLPAWSKLGNKLDHARAKIRNEEQRIFIKLRQHVIENLVRLRRNAAVMDEIDVATSFASLAQSEGWKRPILDMTTDHQIVGGRHPTVKLGLEEQGRTFISNDCILDTKEQIWLVTGPNMAGKSTFLRQNALITILAQVGSYVPAEYARIGVVDQIFSRIGAADDLFRDQSTFMVEMLETAAILKQATSRSFAIMDEVGRGTTPQDGVAVAFGILSHLHQINKCRTLFATHFHRLTDLTADWPKVGRYCTDILDDGKGSFIFQHQLKSGVNRNSHALKVAKLAGLPEPALRIAQGLLVQLQEEDSTAHVQQTSQSTHALRVPASAAAGG